MHHFGILKPPLASRMLSEPLVNVQSGAVSVESTNDSVETHKIGVYKFSGP